MSELKICINALSKHQIYELLEKKIESSKEGVLKSNPDDTDKIALHLARYQALMDMEKSIVSLAKSGRAIAGDTYGR